ncbi:Phospholipase/Carboxylesterase [Bibersteinia trehalosi USDA-ARS-USMARC-190]|uniref:Phospholipase/Carboxylesterase n=1 Tax=Bibersteinia trehalosi USDA-ARS-USMARC-190 TaxID=1263832 RepID=W0R4R7_BIBTR|nr:alpha/beta fold hydrolase [Bibersteinia trehalosi]AHG85270.1 Phospholipase/Carboxylesterase [Bibersteinia trehalosi USDA-ARS-USMARC-190]
MPLIPRAEPLIIRPEKADSAVIFLHGLTTSGLHFESVARYFAQHLPNTIFILPHAPIRPVTWAKGNVSGWYDLRGDNFLANEDRQGILSAAAYVQSLIDDLIRQGVESKRIILGGFSQGGAISLLAGTQYLQPLAGIFCLSGYLPLAQIEQGVAKLAQERALHVQRYPIGHTLSNAEMADLKQWLVAQLTFCSLK